MTRTRHPSNPPLGEALTRREREVLALLAEGLTGPEIAERLIVGTSSVKSHIQHLYGKLGVNSKRQAVSRARELGLLPTALPADGPYRTDVILARLVAAQSGPAARHNLPHQITSLVGRRREMDEGRRLLRNTRLLTLTGPGGTGKTRLALEMAAEGLGDFRHGVWLIELAPIAQPALVPPAVAQALGLQVEGGQTAQQMLTEHLRDKSLLLILDNCEHLVAACAELAERLLRAAPGLRLLASSREPLGVAGETSYPVPALTVPAAAQRATAAELAQSEAVQLFVERAAAVRPDFALTDGNALAVAQICRRLDGIPLAIELAAARTRALTAEQIAARLDQRFGLLTGGSRTAPLRQQTLRGAIDWSYELLADPERGLLRRLSVFSGGWSLEAAEHVWHAPAALDLLSQLVSKSLVLSEQRPDEAARFRMLETIREYAQEKLDEAGEAEAAQDRHLSYYVALAEAAERRDYGEARALNQLDQEVDNLRAALAWAIKHGQSEPAVRLAGALEYFWTVRGLQVEGYGWLEAALSIPAGSGALQPTRWRASAQVKISKLASAVRDAHFTDQVLAWLQESLDAYRALGDKSGMADAMRGLALGDKRFNEPTLVRRQVEEVLELYTAAGDDLGIGVCLHQIGRMAAEAGDRAQALAYFQRSAAVLHDVDASWVRATVLNDLVWLAWLDGDAARARALADENLAVIEALGGGWGLYWVLNMPNLISMAQGDYHRARTEALIIQSAPGRRRNIASGRTRLGLIDYLQGRLPEAQAHLEAALALFRELKDENGMGWVPPWLGAVAYRQGDLDRAQGLIEAGLTIQDRDGPWFELAFSLLARGDVARAQGEPAAAAGYYSRSLEIVIKHSDQPDVAERLEGFAKLAGAAGQPQRAARLFGAAQALRDRLGTPVPPVTQSEYDGALTQVRAQLEAEAFSAAWAEGLALNWEEAAAYALGSPPTATPAVTGIPPFGAVRPPP